MATPQSLPCAKNTDAAKFLLDPAKNLLDLPDAFRPKLCCVSVETDNRFARNGHPLRAKRIRKINTFLRCLKHFFLSARAFFSGSLSAPPCQGSSNACPRRFPASPFLQRKTPLPSAVFLRLPELCGLKLFGGVKEKKSSVPVWHECCIFKIDKVGDCQKAIVILPVEKL